MSGEEDTFNVICTKKISSIYKHLGFLKIFSVIMDWFFVVFFFLILIILSNYTGSYVS